MSLVLAVDPGLRASGCAAYRDSLLVAAAYVKNPIGRGDDTAACAAMADAIWRWACETFSEPCPYREEWAGQLAVERMCVRGPARAKGDPNDLITLSVIAGMLRPSHLYRPEEWKGQMPTGGKAGVQVDVLGARVLSRLSPEEKTRIPDAGAKTHNVIDAIGIGLHHLGRLAPRRVFPGAAGGSG